MTAALVLGMAVGFVALVALSAVLNGWALAILWGWFMVPFGLPALSIPTAIGVALVVSFLTHQTDHYEDKTKTGGERFATSVVAAFIKAPIALTIGWIVKQFL